MHRVRPRTALVAAWLGLLVSAVGGCSSTPSSAPPSDDASSLADNRAPSDASSEALSTTGSSSGGFRLDAQVDGAPDARSGPGTGSSSGEAGTGSSSGGTVSADASSGASSGAIVDAASGSDAAVDVGTAGADPFGCQFAWGEPSPSGSLSSYGWLNFVTTWVGSEVNADGSIGSCSACSMLTGEVASTNLIPAYYAYFIGFYGHANGLPDQNQQPNGPNLATGGGALILGAANSACPSGQICSSNKIVQMYGWYASQSHMAWPTKPLIWLIEGDFIQYTAEATTQTQPLSYEQLGQLAAQIATAIKTNMPNAIVAFDDSSWVNDADRKSYWTAISSANYEMVWTTGVGNNPPFLNAGETSTTYNGGTATYSFLHSYTGKKILVDESAGMSQQSDTWSNQSAATINMLISQGVVAVNVSGAPSTYQSNVTSLTPQLALTCP